MKKLLQFCIGITAIISCTYAQPGLSLGGPEIEFEKELHDFGTIKQFGDAMYEFKFTNTGTAPLVISDAKKSCGCTVPQWPREPIMPGESNFIKVKYDSKRVGPINKSVTIVSNASTPSTVLKIKGLIKANESVTAVPVKERSEGVPLTK